jgi:hypothetical protein
MKWFVETREREREREREIFSPLKKKRRKKALLI